MVSFDSFIVHYYLSLNRAYLDPSYDPHRTFIFYVPPAKYPSTY
ncbi:hypothetical protein PDE_00179 [Penicillium oxalicum 114-2]|uniref:Uncharacterized protein n=1 Tax=Penicillium oxalicum (strain 114-2 / CGMCC 5302) TaxID=933388 RepID=S7Z995_PENO1|nr:hypothetical protein PDE_00179 [Penicillium oxalicum 114-2]